MRLLRFIIAPEWTGATIKEYARRELGFSTRVLAQQKRTPEGIVLNGAPAFTTARLRAGDTLEFTLLPETGDYPPVGLPVSVLFENDDFVITDKLAGMPVHPSPGHDRDSLLNALSFYYRSKGSCPLLCPLYRLDRDTSGVIALGKHTLAVSGTGAEKVYFAVCEGVLSGEGTVDVPIGLEEGSKIKRQCGKGQRAVTHWKALKSENGHTLVAVHLETGRTHQIRVHFAGMGHPLAGDDLYGGSRQIVGRQALHCGRLCLSSRALGMEQEFFADFPAELREGFPWLPPVREIWE